MPDADEIYDAQQAEAEFAEWLAEQGIEKPTNWWLENGLSESDFLDIDQ